MSRNEAASGPSLGAGPGGVEEPWRPRVNPWIIAWTVMLATFMEVLDTSVANVSLLHIAGSLSAGLDESTWVLTSYLVSNAIVLTLSGWLSALFGRKRFYMICVGLFTFSSLLCGLAPSLGFLILFRVLQGIGGGALQPISQAILVESFPREKRGLAMAFYGMGVVFAPIIGPTLGGWITDNFSWRWIFLINLPVGILSITLNSFLVEDPPYFIRKSLKTMHIDFVGLGLLSLGLAALEIMLDKGQREDWFESDLIRMVGVIAVLCLVTVVFWELRHKDPILELRLLKDRNFAVAACTMFMLGFVLYGSTVLLPLFLQTLLGYTAMDSGLVLSPGGVVVALLMPLVGWMISRYEARWLIVTGLVIGGVGLLRMSKFNLQVDFMTAVIARTVQGAGLAFLFVPINTAAFAFIPKEKTNYATGLVNLGRNVGGSAGIALLTTLLARRTQFHQTILVAHMTPYDFAYRQTLQQATNLFMSNGSSPYLANLQGQSLLNGLLTQQSNMLAFNDGFWLLGVLFLGLIPLALLMKSARQPGKARAH